MVFHRKYSSESDKGGFLSVRLLWKLTFPLPRELNKKAPVYCAWTEWHTQMKKKRAG